MTRSFSLLSLPFVLALTLVAPATATEVPFLSSRVNDYANILSSEAIQRLEAKLKAHEDSTTNQVVVLTIASLEGEPIEEYSIRVVEQWKIGTKENDNGILLLVAKEDRAVRIEVGLGLEGVLPDGLCGTIIRHQIIPFFKEGKFDDGVEGGIEAILKAIANEYTAPAEDTAGDDDVPPLPFALGIFAFFLFVVGTFTLSALFSKGFASWFMYVFLIPFWLLFPLALFGETTGLIIFSLYAIGFIVARILFRTSTKGKQFREKWSKKLPAMSGGSGGSGSSWRSSSSGSSFSGGGGGFSGGGASGSW